MERAPTHAAADTTETCEVAAKYTLVSVLARGLRCRSAPRGLSLLVRQGPWIEDVHSAPLHCRVEHILQDVASRLGEPVEHQYLANAEKKLSSATLQPDSIVFLSVRGGTLALIFLLAEALDPDCWRWRTLCSSRYVRDHTLQCCASRGFVRLAGYVLPRLPAPRPAPPRAPGRVQHPWSRPVPCCDEFHSCASYLGCRGMHGPLRSQPAGWAGGE